MTRRVGIVFKGRVRRIFRLDIFFLLLVGGGLVGEIVMVVLRGLW